ncbi:hypothetical protein SSX86_016591 [Deinandra increscens subsp. villosa]|uniref:Uncharacterized protein n=1 Tax=Deinandra increscens subsp. villosa TaxID=3103831 RepID=A0AAP0D2J8_9ASTR
MASSMAARQAATLLRLSSPRSASQAASHIQRRGLAGAADHHGPPKVDFWKDPMSPSLWKEEHFVIVSLTGWGVLIYGGYKLFSGGKKDEVLTIILKTLISFASSTIGLHFNMTNPVKEDEQN